MATDAVRKRSPFAEHSSAPAGRPVELAGRRWPIAYYLAGVGAILLFFEIWTISSWLWEGPKSLTRFQNSHTVDWWAARSYEVAAVIFAIAMAIYIVRKCLTARRLTFDALFVIAGGLLFWVDPFANWFQPIFFYSSNWVNLNAWCGNAPFVVNPTCGRLPEPVLFLGCLYTFGFLGFCIVLNKGMAKIRERYPEISAVKLIGITFLGGMVIDFLLEGPMVAFRLWSYPGWALSLTGNRGDNFRYPFFELVIASILWTGMASLRFFKDDRGHTIAERGLSRFRPRAAAIVTLLSIIGVSQTCAFVSNTILIVHGPFAEPYPTMPVWLNNGMCDIPAVHGHPGTTGSPYGPCPGSPGYQAPIRHLPTSVVNG